MATLSQILLFLLTSITTAAAFNPYFSPQSPPPPSLTYPSHPSATMRGLLTDVVYHLRINSDYTVLALMIQENLDMLSQFYSMTIFAVDDAYLFDDEHLFVSNLRFHIVPNQRLMAVDIMKLPVNSMLPTMIDSERLMVTVAGGGSLLSPMRINNVKITATDVVFNDGIVVHGIPAPFQQKGGNYINLRELQQKLKPHKRVQSLKTEL
ncbi:fasciclin-like arabinogalactan protein 21 [Rutidosis leptorrhynchoides]|uniref:fasciclin-like arabinogalactan protein 21 n=1 Tax=Rutidosis leptorrhynchoides TaxID=125765 RepID=UPI003A99D067